MEQIAVRTTDLFFTLLVAQITLRISELNKASTDTINKIAQGRYNVGKIAENELLQLQLSSMESDQNVSKAKLDIETSRLTLKIYLGNNDDIDNAQMLDPLNIPDFEIDEAMALAEAKKNRAKFVQFNRQKLEAERDVARAKVESGLNVNVTGSFGLNQSADNVPQA